MPGQAIEQAQCPLPSGWRLVRLGEVCEESTGTLDPRSEPEKPFTYVDITSLDNKAKRVVDAKTLIGRNAPSRARQVIRIGDVIVSTTRPNLNAVALIPPELDNQICSTGFCVLRARHGLDPLYLFAFVRTSSFVKSLSDQVKGALYPAVTDKQVRDQFIPLPPLPEQKRFAAILNEQMAAVERARAAAEARLEAAKALPAAYLRAVFNSRKARQWPRVRLGEVTTEAQPGFACGARDPKGVIQLRMNNVDTCGRIVWHEFLRVPADKETISKYQLIVGDVLFNNTNSTELVGKSALFFAHTEPIVYSNHFTRLRVNPERLQPAFLALWLVWQWQLRTFENLCNRWIGQSAVKNDKLLGLEIPLPPPAEQQGIAAILPEQMAAVERARKALEEEVHILNTLPAALLRRAFDGEL